jgi:SnoaL-like protein
MTLGERFARAFAAKDRDTIRALLAEDIDFRGMTPRRFWEATSPDGVLDVLFANWVEDSDHVDGLEYVEQGADVVDTHHVAYRLAISTPDGPHLMEQQAYYRAEDGRMSYLRVMCSGFRPTA